MGNPCLEQPISVVSVSLIGFHVKTYLTKLKPEVKEIIFFGINLWFMFCCFELLLQKLETKITETKI